MCVCVVCVVCAFESLPVKEGGSEHVLSQNH